MEAVVGLMVVVLLGVCHGIETYCDGRQNGAHCYGALGGTVDVQLMDRTLEIFRYLWYKNGTEILSGGKNRNVTNQLKNRSFFTPSNGTLRINNLSRNDGGEYRLEIFDSNGKLSSPMILHLSIEAPVSSVLLVSECLSQGEMRVSCSSEGGDSPQYSWTLDGRTLTDAELLSGNNETNSITLKQHVSGRLVCSVRNHVSHVSKEEKTSDCVFINCTLTNGTLISQWVFAANNTLCPPPTTDPTTVTEPTAGKKTKITVRSTVQPTNITSSNQTVTSPWYRKFYLYIVAGVLSALLFLLLVGVAVIHTQKKKKNSKPKEEEHDQDLTYADVRIMQRQAKQAQQREELEVEYGQVKFTARPQQRVEPTGDECVYAKVRRGR